MPEHSKNLVTLLLQLKNSKVAFLNKTFFPKAHVYLHFVKWNKGNLKRRYPQNVLTFCLVQTLCCHKCNGVFNLQVQNYLDFIKQMNGLQGNCCMYSVNWHNARYLKLANFEFSKSFFYVKNHLYYLKKTYF